jgi:hypothetical protein
MGNDYTKEPEDQSPPGDPKEKLGEQYIDFGNAWF